MALLEVTLEDNQDLPKLKENKYAVKETYCGRRWRAHCFLSDAVLTSEDKFFFYSAEVTTYQFLRFVCFVRQRVTFR